MAITSVVFGTRSSSSTSTETSQVSPSHWNAVTDSGRVVGELLDRAPGSPGEIASRHPLVRLVACVVAVRVRHVGFVPPSASGNQACDELVLDRSGLLVTDLAGLARRFDLHQACADRALVVVLGLRLGEQLLGDPDGAADRRQREREQARDQAHAGAPTACSPVKLYGGSGPR